MHLRCILSIHCWHYVRTEKLSLHERIEIGKKSFRLIHGKHFDYNDREDYQWYAPTRYIHRKCCLCGKTKKDTPNYDYGYDA